jgi:hypothetical protein
MNMTVQESAKHISAHIGYAFLVALTALIGIEWLMPGSVLPFINLIDLLPFAIIIIIALLAFKKRRKGFFNLLHIIIGILITFLLLASLLANVPSYGLRTWLLTGSATLLIIAWSVAMNDVN